MTYTVPLRRTSLQFSQMRFTLARTFMAYPKAQQWAEKFAIPGTTYSSRHRQFGKVYISAQDAKE